MSTPGTGENANASSYGYIDVSSDGRYSVYSSTASNLVVGDNNGRSDVFWRSIQGGATVWISLTQNGNPVGDSHSPSVSADGRWVAFTSDSRALVGDDYNTYDDVYLWDSVLRTIIRPSKRTLSPFQLEFGPSSEPDISGDGRFVVFSSEAWNLVQVDTNAFRDVFLYDRISGSLELISRPAGSQANGASFGPRISEDGNFIAFSTGASNLVQGDTNQMTDVVVYDRQLQLIAPVSNNPNAILGNGHSFCGDISSDGSFVVFESTASNLVAADGNGKKDVFRWRRSNGAIIRISVGTAGVEANGDSSRSRCNSSASRISFTSAATNLVPSDSNGFGDVFVRDTAMQLTTRMSEGAAGLQANGSSDFSSMSGDGRYTCFVSSASNIVPNGISNMQSVLAVGDLCTGASTYCVPKLNSNACVPFICSEGFPSLGSANGFTVTAGRVLNQKSGIFFWGRASAAVPLYGGTRCVQNPVVRSQSQDSGGNPSINDCSGSYRFQFDQAYMNLHGLVPGDTIYGQFWSRDPFFALPNNIGLTDGLEFTVAP